MMRDTSNRDVSAMDAETTPHSTAASSVVRGTVLSDAEASHQDSVIVQATTLPNSATGRLSAAAGSHEEVGQGSDSSDSSYDADSSAASSSDGAAESDEPVALEQAELLFDFGRYVGQVNAASGLREGKGVMHYTSGNVFDGNWMSGAPQGFGEKRYKNGDIYRGTWREGERSGRGAYLFVQGHFFEGMYKKDQADGYGIFTTLAGDRYAGEWKAGRKHGKGRETLANGQVFVGLWRDGKKQGRGKLYLPGANSYIYGIWNDDHFFRELTQAEMGAAAEADIVDEHGVPRQPSAPASSPPWEREQHQLLSALGGGSGGVTDRVLQGVSALEQRMEALGMALERVIGSTVDDAEEEAAVQGVAEVSLAAEEERADATAAAPGPAAPTAGVEGQQPAGDAWTRAAQEGGMGDVVLGTEAGRDAHDNQTA